MPGNALLVGSAIYFGFAIWSTVAFIRYLKSSPIGWLYPLGAASIFCLVLAILSYMFLQSVRMVADANCLGLERDILLEHLDAAEIKRRFLLYLAGPDLGQWYEEALKDLKEKDQALRSIYDEARTKKNEIAQIDEAYVAERRSRALRSRSNRFAL
jgi:hypothetical protein